MHHSPRPVIHTCVTLTEPPGESQYIPVTQLLARSINLHKASRSKISPSRPPLRNPKVMHQKAQARTSYCPAAPSLTKPAAPPPPPRPTLGPPPRPASHFRSSGTYLPTRQRGPRAKRRGHALQNSETTQTAPKRRCAGTTAKLTACVGRNTPLCVRDQRRRRRAAGSRTSCAGASGRTSGGRGRAEQVWAWGGGYVPR